MTENQAPAGHTARDEHTALRMRFEHEVEALGKTESKLSTARLVSFLAAVSLIGGWMMERQAAYGLLGLLCAAGFIGAVIRHAQVSNRREGARLRRDLHDRHLRRMDGRWVDFPNHDAGLLPATHAYAGDIDLIGRGSLLQRIDVSHTVLGQRALVAWLGSPAAREVIEARQAAVAELAKKLELRQELEASARGAEGDHKIDGSGFAAFATRPSLYAKYPWLTAASVVLPLCTLGLWVAGQAGIVPPPTWLLPLTLQIGLLTFVGRHTTDTFNLVGARQGVLEAFEGMLRVVEHAELEAPALRGLTERLQGVGGTPPSEALSRLQKLGSYAQLRQQFLLWAFINPLLMWDLHVLRGLERWNAEVGARTADWMQALGEFEALSSLATLAAVDPDATFPRITDDGGVGAEALAHPLLLPDKRVANDVALCGPNSLMMITGSNMAGKSTLLRSVGLNVALGLAGGPVCARAMTLTPVRLRASMRAVDELQEGASYFHAELTKLRTVVAEADARPPILFLLDELLRGTNERARHVGARAVITHLLNRGAMGFVATHDVALAKLGDALSEHTTNVHFTDVVVDNEMRFDYRLRPGIVQTSNALRLLAMAGIEVPEAERRALESPAPSATVDAAQTSKTPAAADPQPS